MPPTLIRPSENDLETILKNHELWLKTKGQRGQRGDLSCMEIIDQDLSRRLLSGIVLQNAVLQNVNLNNTALTNAELHGATLRACDLRWTEQFHYRVPLGTMENCLMTLSPQMHFFDFSTLSRADGIMFYSTQNRPLHGIKLNERREIVCAPTLRNYFKNICNGINIGQEFLAYRESAPHITPLCQTHDRRSKR